MRIKGYLGKIFASIIHRRTQKWIKNPIEAQKKVFSNLISKASKTGFGRDHHFGALKSYEDFKANVPIRDYEGLKPYINRIIAGELNVLWPGKPNYFCKTSGTTSGIKYIPISKDSIPYHISSARNAILSYIHETGNTDFIDGRMIFLSGSPSLNKIGAILIGRLSGIVNHHVPGYLRKNQMPSYATNCIEDWETKVSKIAEETLPENMTLISGIPSWVQMYFDKLLSNTKKKSISEIFPNFSLFIYGGVNFGPYQKKFETTIGKKIDSIELYPASEGFIAYQDSQGEKGMLLLLDAGIFYEFIPVDEFYSETPNRISIADVKVSINYVLILNTNAGLWGYNIGDTVKFVSTDPYRIIVTGRIKHYTSAFGEHVIAEEVEKALSLAAEECNAEITEFTVAPQVNPTKGLPYHEWFVEYGKKPENAEKFRLKIDSELQKINIYYRDLIQGNVLQPLVLRSLKKDAFITYMKKEGKLGGQNKVPRLSNDRKIADLLAPLIEE
jgi:hypothetical protein